ncbi:MAG: hypothetical protein WAN36_06085 [Calditrichia bacterium]
MANHSVAAASPGRFPVYGIAGIVLIIISEIGLIFHWWFFEIFMTACCWTGLILFTDAWNYRLSGNSLIMTRRREFLWMLPASVALWYFFEFYNLFIQNWHYVGLPENIVLRYFGYFWAFATIWPAIFEIYELTVNYHLFESIKIKPLRLSPYMLTVSWITGLIFMIIPFFVPLSVAVYLAAPVWVGMVLLLDPLNYHWGKPSLWGDLSRGDLSRLLQLFLTGIIAGFLWEFWNYWATAKWIYTVPILGDVKIFEMPVLGYLGFPAFAVEVFVMWISAKYVLRLK